MKIPSRETLGRWFLSRDAPLFVQFAKYGASGVISTLLLLAVVMTLSATAIPAMDWSLIDGEPITDAVRQRNLVVNNLIAFPISNLSAYLLNIWLVFTPGRHSKKVEFGFFTLVSGISFCAGLFGGPLLIKSFGIPTIAAQFSFVITSALVNFLCRKFLIFQK